MNEIKTPNTMSPEEQRIAIAEACGFFMTRVERDADGKIKLVWAETPDTWRGKDARPWLPDFLNDLNACHEFEKILDKMPNIHGPGVGICSAIEVYEDMLLGMCDHPIRATASQRCEAFLKTIDRWKE